MKAYITGFLADKGLLPKYMASAVYPASELKSREAKAFGCSVDYNAWTEMPNEKPCGEELALEAPVHTFT